MKMKKHAKAAHTGGQFVTSMNPTEVSAGNTAKGFTMGNKSDYTMGVGKGSTKGNSAKPMKARKGRRAY